MLAQSTCGSCVPLTVDDREGGTRRSITPYFSPTPVTAVYRFTGCRSRSRFVFNVLSAVVFLSCKKRPKTRLRV